MSAGFARTWTGRAALWALKENVINSHEYAKTLADNATLTSKAIPLGYGAGGFTVQIYAVFAAGTGAYTLNYQPLTFDTGPDQSGTGIYTGEEWGPSVLLSSGTLTTATWLSVPFSPDAAKAGRFLLKNNGSGGAWTEVRGFINWGG